jgi:hypothetical protein
MVPRLGSKIIIIALVVIGALIAMATHFMAPISNASSAIASTSTVPMYLLSAVGACRGPTGYSPCFGGDIAQAEVFNCANAATLAMVVVE